jgi:hypothetical protein
MPITDQDYLSQRLDEQYNWLEKKAAWNQSRYKHLRMVEIAAAALIPALVALGLTGRAGEVASALLGIVIALSAGAMSLFKFHEKWVQYRSTAEQLKHERFLYDTQTGPYAGPERYAALVERVESILMKENAAWAKTFAPKSAKEEKETKEAKSGSTSGDEKKPGDAAEDKPAG